jgi:uncharacterized protein YyaL (SSP411 family)
MHKPNHLAGQTSPYLLQHLHNPVDWHPWGGEALRLARERDVPIFLSVGYAACHWCHVMERECFEDERIAAFLNEHFVAIKVDREERPDVDEIYMTAVQMMTGHGGWPLNVFLTPDGKPFFGGTYWPPEDRRGMPGFPTVLAHLARAWDEKRGDVEGSAAEIASHLESAAGAAIESDEDRPAGRAETQRAAAQLAGRFDARWGGLGQAPKFPPHGAIDLLLRESHRTGEATPRAMAETTLDRMALGGMYDQIGGGFARYSVDERWLVPHFEKMLYDQALLVPVYTDAWRVTRKPLYRRVVEETLDFLRREMTHPDGGLYASLDADSEGHEGKFYIWSAEEVDAVLGAKDGADARAAFGITEAGNFEGANIPNHLGGAPDEALVPRLSAWKAKLLAARARRIRPATDDKILTAWNGLAITAFCRAWQAFGREEDLRSARLAADFVRTNLFAGGRLLVTWREGKAQLPAYLDDHAFLARGLIDLYESAFDRRDLDDAVALARTILARFADPRGGFHFTADDHERLLVRTRSLYDGAMPSGAGVATEVLVRLASHLDDAELRRAAVAVLAALRPLVERAPTAFASLLAAADFVEGPALEVVVAGSPDDPDAQALARAAWTTYLPNRTVAFAIPGEAAAGRPVLEGKRPSGGRAAAYVCRNRTCSAPVTTPDALFGILGGP